jgi:hypothetical protein
VGQSLGEVKFGVGVDASKATAHTPVLPAWLRRTFPKKGPSDVLSLAIENL